MRRFWKGKRCGAKPMVQLSDMGEPSPIAERVMEAVAYDGGRPSFGALQERMHVQSPTAQLLARVPVTYHVFDVLHLGEHSTLPLPYRERRDRYRTQHADARFRDEVVAGAAVHYER